jgi:hypothetical protein
MSDIEEAIDLLCTLALENGVQAEPRACIQSQNPLQWQLLPSDPENVLYSSWFPLLAGLHSSLDPVLQSSSMELFKPVIGNTRITLCKVYFVPAQSPGDGWVPLTLGAVRTNLGKSLFDQLMCINLGIVDKVSKPDLLPVLIFAGNHKEHAEWLETDWDHAVISIWSLGRPSRLNKLRAHYETFWRPTYKKDPDTGASNFVGVNDAERLALYFLHNHPKEPDPGALLPVARQFWLAVSHSICDYCLYAPSSKPDVLFAEDSRVFASSFFQDRTLSPSPDVRHPRITVWPVHDESKRLVSVLGVQPDRFPWAAEINGEPEGPPKAPDRGSILPF